MKYTRLGFAFLSFLLASPSVFARDPFQGWGVGCEEVGKGPRLRFWFAGIFDDQTKMVTLDSDIAVSYDKDELGPRVKQSAVSLFLGSLDNHGHLIILVPGSDAAHPALFLDARQPILSSQDPGPGSNTPSLTTLKGTLIIQVPKFGGDTTSPMERNVTCDWDS